MRTFTLAVLLLASTSGIYAQQLFAGGRLGMGISSFTGTSAPGLSHKSVVAPSFGGVIGYKFNDMFAAFGELSFSMQGGREKGYPKSTNSLGKETTSIYLTDARYFMHYINIPIFARAYFGDPEEFQFFVSAGPYVGVLVSAKRTLSIDGRRDERNASVSKLFNTLDYGITAGVGVELPSETDGKISFEVRYNYGLANIAKSGSTVGNSVLVLSGAYIFPLK